MGDPLRYGVDVAGEDFGGEHEQEPLSPSSEVRQGDILQMLPDAEAEEWTSHFGVLVTANCDLVHAKSGGVATYIPVVPIEVYVGAMVIPAEVQRHDVRSQRTLEQALDRHAVGMTSVRIEEMLSLHETPRDIALLAGLEGHALRDFEKAVERVGACRDAQQKLVERSFQEKRSCLTRLLSVLNGLEASPSRKPIAQLVREDVISRIRSLPSDALYLGSLSPQNSHGYVAYLRLLREIRIERIALRPSEERTAPERQFEARRISRLRLLYTHKILQQMAAVFTDIGLPEDYETYRNASIVRCAESWFSEADPLDGAEPKVS